MRRDPATGRRRRSGGTAVAPSAPEAVDPPGRRPDSGARTLLPVGDAAETLQRLRRRTSRAFLALALITLLSPLVSPVGFLARAVAQGSHQQVVALVSVVVAAQLLVGWRWVRQHRRHARDRSEILDVVGLTVLVAVTGQALPVIGGLWFANLEGGRRRARTSLATSAMIATVARIGPFAATDDLGLAQGTLVVSWVLTFLVGFAGYLVARVLHRMFAEMRQALHREQALSELARSLVDASDADEVLDAADLAVRALGWSAQVLTRLDVDRARELEREGSEWLVSDLMHPDCTPVAPPALEPSFVAAGHQVRQALDRVRALEQLRRQSEHDALTGLYNRGAFLERAVRLLARDRGAVLYLDLDGFKAVNDLHGHAAGDAVLVSVAQRLRDALRPCDLVGRLGGDELAVVLPGVQEGAALQTVARLEEVVAAPVEDVAPAVTASIGAAVSDEAEDVEELLALADSRMFSHKQRRAVGRARPQAGSPQRVRS